MNNDLHNLYRPKTFKEIIGQNEIKKSIEFNFKSGKIPHTFLFHGPAGSGKTTMARIIANQLNIEQHNIIEVDAASHSGADAMREITKTANYKGFGSSPNKAIIIDEVHSLSKQAFQVLLKPLEEPSKNVYYVLCTTEINKVHKTIQTRCNTYLFSEAKEDDLEELLEMVCEEEEIDLNDKIIDLIIKESNGSYRQALSNLSVCRDVKSIKEAEILLQTVSEQKQIIDLCRYLLNSSGTIQGALKLLKSISEDGTIQPESIRLLIVNYMAKVALSNPKNLEDVLTALSCFSTPCNPNEKMAPIILSLADYFN